MNIWVCCPIRTQTQRRPRSVGKFNLMDLLNTQQSGQAEPPQVSEREETQPRKPAYKIIALSVFDLVPSEGNFYSIAEIEKLKRDIELAGGVKQNLTVIPLDGGKYKVLAGHRRRRACLELVQEGKPEYEYVPCGIEPRQQDKEMQEIREELLIITTNSQREKTDWDRVQETKHLHDVLRRYKARGGKLPGRLREIIADTLNTSETQIGRMGAIAKNLIPEFQEEMREKRLGISAAYELSGMPEEQQRAALEEYRAKGSFSVNDAKQRKEAEGPQRRKVRTLDEAWKERQQQSGDSDSGAGQQAPPPAISPQQEQPAAPAPQDRPAPESSGRQDGEESEIVSTINRLNDLCAYCMDKGEQCDGSRDWTLDVKALLSAIERLGGETE
nr:MAG TPA: chromosome partitioning protein [Caudoviricetes sp.]